MAICIFADSVCVCVSLIIHLSSTGGGLCVEQMEVVKHRSGMILYAVETDCRDQGKVYIH